MYGADNGYRSKITVLVGLKDKETMCHHRYKPV